VASDSVRPGLFIACGTEDFLIEPNRDLHNCLSEIGYPHIYHESPGIHDWVFWESYIEKALIWLDSLN
jgi:S-formylglutathione hydrolase FrmB